MCFLRPDHERSYRFCLGTRIAASGESTSLELLSHRAREDCGSGVVRIWTWSSSPVAVLEFLVPFEFSLEPLLILLLFISVLFFKITIVFLLDGTTDVFRMGLITRKSNGWKVETLISKHQLIGMLGNRDMEVPADPGAAGLGGPPDSIHAHLGQSWRGVEAHCSPLQTFPSASFPGD